MARGGDLGAIVWYEKTRRGVSDKQLVEHSGAVDLKGYVHVSPDDWDEGKPTPQP